VLVEKALGGWRPPGEQRLSGAGFGSPFFFFFFCSRHPAQSDSRTVAFRPACAPRKSC
jgi:hypothetical protein